MTDPAIIAKAREIAEGLKEPNTRLVHRVVEILGIEAAHAHYIEALGIEAAGGELIASGKRRRTPGGIFFRLVRAAATPDQRRLLGWSTGEGASQPPAPPRPRRSHSEKIEPLPWAALTEHLPALLAQKGTANMSKITLIGRPGRIVETQGVMLTIMTTDPTKAPTLPKGLPVPPAKPTSYVVYIAAKQWAKVAEAIKDPTDALIIEGYPVYEERLPGIAVLSSNITTRNLQRAKREAESTSAPRGVTE